VVIINITQIFIMRWEEPKDYSIISVAGFYFVTVLSVIFVSNFTCSVCESIYF